MICTLRLDFLITSLGATDLLGFFPHFRLHGQSIRAFFFFRL